MQRDSVKPHRTAPHRTSRHGTAQHDKPHRHTSHTRVTEYANCRTTIFCRNCRKMSRTTRHCLYFSCFTAEFCVVHQQHAMNFANIHYITDNKTYQYLKSTLFLEISVKIDNRSLLVTVRNIRYLFFYFFIVLSG